MSMYSIHRTSTTGSRFRCNTLMLLGALLTSAIISNAHAELYSWKDASGVTHYSDSPPPEGTPNIGNVRQVQGAEISPDAAKQAADIERKTLESNKGFEDRQKKRDDEAKQASDKQQNAARKKAACDESQAYLRTLQSGIRIATHDADGNQSFMSPDQVQAKTAETSKAIQENCY